MNRRWYNREKTRETIRMAMGPALRRHHPRGVQDSEPTVELACRRTVGDRAIRVGAPPG